MTHRREDESLIDWLKSVESRVDRLEKGDKAVRQNNIRIGGTVIEVDEDSTQLVINRLSDGNQRKAGNIEGTLHLRFIGYGPTLPEQAVENDVFILITT